MSPIHSLRIFLVSSLTMVAADTKAFAEGQPKLEALPPAQSMYVIERDISNLGSWRPEQIQGAAQKSCGVLSELGPQIKWLHSYVTAGKMYCVYLAPNEAMVREHAKRGGFPANSVTRVQSIIGPQTATTLPYIAQ